MTRSQHRRAVIAGRKALRAAEIQQMKETQKDGVGVGRFEPKAPVVTGAVKRRRGGSGERARRGYLHPLSPRVEFDTYERDTAGASSASG